MTWTRSWRLSWDLPDVNMHPIKCHVDLLVFFSGSVLVMLMNPVTVRHGRCGCRRCLKWSLKNVGTPDFIVSFFQTMHLIKWPPHALTFDLHLYLMDVHDITCCCRFWYWARPCLWTVAGVSEAYEDAANCLWLLSNSKPCANCKSPIQKNEGCNHMQCSKVSTEWLMWKKNICSHLNVSPLNSQWELSENDQLLHYGVKRSDILNGEVGNHTYRARLLRFNIWFLKNYQGHCFLSI